MKVLVLSCNTGEGHNSSAKALKQAMDKRGFESDVKDTLSFAGAFISDSVSKLYNYSINGTLFYRIYKLGDWMSNRFTGIMSPIYYANKLYAKRLYQYIVMHEYDAIVAVHLFAAEALTAIKRKYRLTVPTLFVMTDYTSIPFLRETELDRYAIPHQDLVEEFVIKGIPEEKITVTGIPVSGMELSISKANARNRVNSAFNWKPGDHSNYWFLVMGGSMGFGSMEQLISSLCKETSSLDRIICICGRNKELQKKITRQFSGFPQVKAIGYTDKIPLLMRCSDILFSKPGGITSTEAIVNNIPLVHTAPIPGFEHKNALFFHYHNISYYTTDAGRQVTAAIRLCKDKAYRSRMLKAQKRNANTKTCDVIIELISKMVQP